jgi:hypothetical protein
MVEIGLTVSALITLAFFSIAFKMNPAFRVAESLFLGALAGQIFVTAWNSIRAVDITPLTSGTNFLPALVSIAVGVLVFTRPTKDYSWLARYPSSLMVGTTTGLVLGKIIDVQVFSLVRPLFTQITFENLLAILIILVIGMYFTFADVKNETIKNILAQGRSIGRPIVFAFYVTWGYSLMVFGRTTAMIERLIFLVLEWLPSLTR